MARKFDLFGLFKKTASATPRIKETYYIGGSKKYLPSDRNYSTFSKECFMENVIVHRCVSMIANAASSVELLLYRVTSNGEKIEATEHPLYKILKHPNSAMNTRNFIANLVSYFLIDGNAYVYASRKNGKIVGFDLLRPDRIEIYNDVQNSMYIYKYSIDGNVYELKNKYEESGDLLHIKNFHPLDDLYGLSFLNSAYLSINHYTECIKWNKSLLENGGRPSGAIVVNTDGAYSDGLTDEQFDQIQSQLRNSYSGFDNAGKVLILEGGLDWKDISINPKDMDFLEAKNSAARDIAFAFGVPPQMLGIKGDSTYNNMSEARLAFWEETVLPILDMICFNISNWSACLFNSNIQVSFDKDSISALSDKRQKIWNSINNANFITDEEKRQMFGFNKNFD